MINFYRTLNKPKYNDGLYILENNELYYTKPIYSNYTFMLGYGYVGLDVDLTNMRLVGVSGYCPINCIIEQELFLPTILKEATVTINYSAKLLPGSGEYLYDSCNAYFDKNLNLLCFCKDLGIANEALVCVKFMSDAYICTNKDCLLAVYIKLTELNTNYEQ